MLTEKDYKDSQTTLGLIEHVKAEPSRLSFEKIVDIFEFILVGIQMYFFNSAGKPKSIFQLVIALPAIVKFIKQVLYKINGKGLVVKPVQRVKAKRNG